MSAIWQVHPPRCEATVPATTVAALLDVVSSPASSDALLRAVQSLVPVDYLSVVRIQRDLPELIEGSASRPQDSAVVSRCFSIYRRHYYRRDALLPLASRLGGRPTADALTLHCRADELPDAGWRSDIYEQEHLCDRFTLLHAPAAGSVQAINLYRDDRQGGFRPQEVARLHDLAPLLRRAHAGWWARHAAEQTREDRIGAHEQRLRTLAPALSARERAVCARIAEGLSVDGIAADLDVAPSTVSTLRKRAYQKLADTGFAANRQGLARLLG
jgi:DNA-binding CsgD family transcriptional regulator